MAAGTGRFGCRLFLFGLLLLGCSDGDRPSDLSMGDADTSDAASDGGGAGRDRDTGTGNAGAGGMSGGDAGLGDGGPTTEDPYEPPCEPKSCLQQGATCGAIDDGCGGVLRCGSCMVDQLCDPASHRCRSLESACMEEDKQCGVLLDACGAPRPCGSCPTGEVCDAASGRCGECQPRECAELMACGMLPDGCGGTAQCGTCDDDDQACDAVSYRCA